MIVATDVAIIVIAMIEQEILVVHVRQADLQ